jgi:arylsulfatase
MCRASRGPWKAVFYEQRAKTMQLWAEPFVTLRLPKTFNLRRDPFKRADENSKGYWNWLLEHVFVISPMQALAAEQIQSFREFPPRQDPAAFDLDSIMASMTETTGGGLR